MTDPSSSAKPHATALSGTADRTPAARATVRPEQLARLRLDPTAVRRALGELVRREPAAKVRSWSVAAVAHELGSLELDRLLRESPRPSVCTLQHAATAHACAELARQSGLLASDEAYLLGLLHDPLAGLDGTADLPEPLRRPLERAVHTPDEDELLPPEACLVPAAALLAGLAGFAGPERSREPHPSVQAFALSTASMAVDELRAAVAADLLEAGLDPEAVAGLGPARPGGNPKTTPVDPATLTLHLLRGGEGILSGQRLADWCCRAAVADLEHDRATFVHWIGSETQLVVRACATSRDSGSRRHLVRATGTELAALGRATETGCTVRVELDADAEGGLLAFLGAPSVLVAPVCKKGHSPSFLVVDRCDSGRRLPDPTRDAMLTVLAEATSMRFENLLLERRSRRSAQSALVDPLTRLWNRRFGMATLNQSMARARRSGTELTVLMIDIDQFKKLNDTYGHARGDIALRTTAEVLRKTLRRSDMICRYGGEEFLVVLPETAAEEAALLAARLFIEIETRGHEVQLPLTASIGQTSLRETDTTDSLLLRADRALYASKSLGRNRFSIDAEDL